MKSFILKTINGLFACIFYLIGEGSLFLLKLIRICCFTIIPALLILALVVGILGIWGLPLCIVAFGLLVVGYNGGIELASYFSKKSFGFMKFEAEGYLAEEGDVF